VAAPVRTAPLVTGEDEEGREVEEALQVRLQGAGAATAAGGGGPVQHRQPRLSPPGHLLRAQPLTVTAAHSRSRATNETSSLSVQANHLRGSDQLI